jgi:hypothetical protein
MRWPTWAACLALSALLVPSSGLQAQSQGTQGPNSPIISGAGNVTIYYATPGPTPSGSGGPVHTTREVAVELLQCAEEFRSLRCHIQMTARVRRIMFRLLGSATSARANSAFAPAGSRMLYPAGVNLGRGGAAGAINVWLEPDAPKTAYLLISDLPAGVRGGVLTVWYEIDRQLGRAEFAIAAHGG